MQNRLNSPGETVQPYRSTEPTARRDSISNSAIIIAAIFCLGALILVIVTTLVIREVFYETAQTATNDAANPHELNQALPQPPEVTTFDEGYSIILPSGFAGQTRLETTTGDIVYTFTAESGCKLHFALINDDTIDRFASPPKSYQDSLIQHIPDFSVGIEGEVAPERVTINGMPSVLFRFYEKETFRGVVFTYYMVSMDRGKKLALKIAGKYGNYSDEDANISMPDHWYDSMLTLKRTGPAR